MILSDEDKLDFYNNIQEMWDHAISMKRINSERFVHLNEDFSITKSYSRYSIYSQISQQALTYLNNPFGPSGYKVELFSINLDGKFAYLHVPEETFTTEDFEIIYDVVVDLISTKTMELIREEEIKNTLNEPIIKTTVKTLVKKYGAAH